MNVDIFIPARLNSTRLPKKQLEKINGIPSIEHLVNRLKNSKKIRKIIVCTTNNQSDDMLVDFLKEEKILYFRGDEKDILKRFFDATKEFSTDIIIDVEGDKIYTDPVYVDKIISIMENSDYDFVEGGVLNDEPLHGIHGLVPAGIRTSALKKICKLKTTNNTETGYKEFFRNKKNFRNKIIYSESKLKFPKNLRLTLDYPEDLELCKQIFAELGNDFHEEDIIKLFDEKPDLLKITEPLIKKWDEYYEKNITDYSLKF